jgi:DNA-binding transcriptional regulator YiaG
MSTENDGAAFGDALIGALEEAVAYEGGELAGTRVNRVEITARHARVPEPPAYTPEQIRTIRHAFSMSQQVFAGLLNASASAVRAWEQGAREPDGPTRRLLQVAELNPDALTNTAHGLREFRRPAPARRVAERPAIPFGTPRARDPK